MKEGFAIGAGLIVIGLVLEMAVGPVRWAAFAFPMNWVVLAAFLLAIVVATLVRRNNYPLHFLTTHRAAVPAIVYALVLTTVMGLTCQTDDGRWLNDMLTFWPFVLIYLYIAFLLGQLVLRRITHMVRPKHKHSSSHHHHHSRNWRRDIAFLLNHGGLLVVLLCSTLGSPDVEQRRMVALLGQLESRATTDLQLVKEMPFSVELQRFILEEYADGTPSRFASEVQVVTHEGKKYNATIDVNHPLKISGWEIYQYGYDTAAGAQSRYSILELVHDPWQPYVYAGIFMMLCGALFLCFSRSYASKGLTEEEYKAMLEKEAQKKAKQAEKEKLAREFRGEGEGKSEHRHHHHHHHHSNDSDDSDDLSSHYHTER